MSLSVPFSPIRNVLGFYSAKGIQYDLIKFCKIAPMRYGRNIGLLLQSVALWQLGPKYVTIVKRRYKNRIRLSEAIS